MWAEHEVSVRRQITKHIDHSELGPLQVDCQVLDIPDTDQRLVLYVAAPNSDFHRALERLRAADIGTLTVRPA